MNQSRRKTRHARLRSRVKGSSARPRASVFRSARALRLQFIDDEAGRTLLSFATDTAAKKSKIVQAQELGKTAAAAAKKHKITRVVFDRGGYAYHGRVKAVADSLREGGLDF